ncbi:MAG: hypothetical protein ACLQLH_15570 [Terracidiphilus sp.]|jgi:hypothetical protein
MRIYSCLVVLVLATNIWSQSPRTVIVGAQSKQAFDGKWWVNTELGERSGFLNGASDCLTWTAHKKGFNSTPEQIMDKIDKYYITHPGSASLNVIDVWQKVADHSKASAATSDSGEIWKNPHWYLNGGWWGQVSETEQLGFVEGYLWCLRTQVPAPTESYSGIATSYRRKIDAFVRANPKLGNEAVAVTLHRFRDTDVMAAPK